MAQGTYYPPVGTQVTCWDNREFLGQSQRPFSADPSPQAVGSQLLNRISSIKVPRGLRVTLIDSNNPNEPDPRRRVTIYPGYYPYIGQWEDRTDFVLVEEIDPNEPIFYMIDEQQNFGSPYLFQGFGVQGNGPITYQVENLFCNDCFEAVYVRGLIQGRGFRDFNLTGRGSDWYRDPDGIGRRWDLPNDNNRIFDEVSSVQIRKPGSNSDGWDDPARIASANQVQSGSDYFATVAFTVVPSTSQNCWCNDDTREFAQAVGLIYEGVQATLSQPARTSSAWSNTLQIGLEPGLENVEATFNYNSGDRASGCIFLCGYAQDSRVISLSTADLKAPTLDSFAITDAGEVDLFWTKNSDVPDNLIEINIKRDGQIIETLPGTARSFATDQFPSTGPFDYTIEMIAFNKRATSNALEIYPPVGIIRGNVSTRPGGLDGTTTDVPNVEVCAIQQNDLPGRPAGTTYCATTNNEGNYIIDNIYFGEEATFQIVPSKPGHGFDPGSRERTLNPQRSSENNVDFTDTTSFNIAGNVFNMYDGAMCPLQGIQLELNGILQINPTDADGNFFLLAEQAGEYTITPILEGHTFEPASITIDVGADVTGLEFEDVTLDTISGAFLASCEQYIGDAVIRITSPDGCIETFLETNPGDGTYSAILPARNYRIEVIEVFATPESGLNDGEVTGFFEPEEVDITAESAVVDFTYRRPPTLEIVGFPDAACPDIPYPILEQYSSTILDIFVWEEVGVCAIDTGTLRIVNTVAEPAETIELPIQDGRVRYSVFAAAPNIISPYTQSISFTALIDGRTVEQQVEVIVTGARARERTFTTVTPELPLMILRDPPGDASSSYLSQNTTFQTKTSFSTKRSDKVDIWSKIKAGTKFEVGPLFYSTEVHVWGEIGASLAVTASTQNNEEFTTSITTSESFSTSNSEIVTGTEGDVFVGAAMNLIYALADEVIYDPVTCSISRDTTLIMGNDGFATTYVYTEDHIRKVLIPQLHDLIELNKFENPDTADYYVSQVKVWEQTLQRNEDLKNDAVFVENRSFSGNAPYTSSVTSSSSKTISIQYTDDIDSQIAAEAGLEVAGIGFSAGARYNFRMETGIGSGQTTIEQMTTGFTLNDDDQGDFFSVDIKTDPVYNTPVFETVSGRSSCPYESMTQPRDEAQISVDNLVQTDVNPDGQAVFRLKLGNISQSDETRIYLLKFSQASNPDGAKIRVGGSEIQDAIPYTIPPGQEVEATVTVERGPVAYTYNDLQFSLVSQCDTSISSSVGLSVYFQSDCSDVTLETDEGDQWLVNSGSNNALDIRLKDYDKNGLDRISIQYAPAGTGAWSDWTIVTPEDLSDLPGGTELTLDAFGIPDGAYKLRARLTCDQGFVYSQVLSGRMDRTPPVVFGTPEPNDDRYLAGDELSVTFNESINCQNLGAGDVLLIRESDQAMIPVQLNCAGRTLTIIPQEAIEEQSGERFIVEIINLEDASQNGIAEPVSWLFTAGEDLVRTPDDQDGDGVPNADDNCVDFPNSNQQDIDGDGIGDRCDNDNDNDGIENDMDLCPTIPNVGLSFDGKNDFVQFAPMNEWNFATDQDFTIELWLNIPVNDQSNTTDSLHSIIEKFGAVYPFGIRYNSQSKKLVADRFDGTAGPTVQSTTLLNDGQWHHIAFVKEGTVLKLLVDGQEEDRTTDTTTESVQNNAAVNLGKQESITNFWLGTLDELRIWNIARSPLDLFDNFDREIPGTEAGLVGYFTFTEGTPAQDNGGVDLILDQSESGNNGQLINFEKSGNQSNWIIGAPIAALDANNDGIGDACQEITTSTASITNRTLFRLFPNPAGDQVTLDITAPVGGDIQVEVYNQYGQRLRTEAYGLQANQQVLDILDTSQLPDGLYFITLRREQEVISRKLMIQR